MYLSLLSFRDLLRTWRGALRVGRRTFLEIAGIYTGLFLLLVGFQIFAQLTAKEPGITIALAVILIIPYAIANWVLTLACYEAMHAALGGTLMPLRQAVSNGLHRLLSSIWVLALQSLVGMLVLVPFGAILGVLVMANRAGNDLFAGAGAAYALLSFGIIGIVLVIAMVVTMIIVGLKVQYGLPALIADGLRGTKAIKASWHMTSGRLWSVIWRTVLFGIVLGVPLYIISTTLALLPLFGSDTASPALSQEVWGALITGPSTTLFVLIQVGVSTILWKELKRVKEAERPAAMPAPMPQA